MKSHANSRPLTFQVTLTVLALALFTLALVVGFGFFATMSADNDALQRQKAFVANGLQDAVDALMREQESVAVWDDAVTFAKAHDEQWMSENLGEWMYSYYGHDRAFVLDEHEPPGLTRWKTARRLRPPAMPPPSPSSRRWSTSCAR